MFRAGRLPWKNVFLCGLIGMLLTACIATPLSLKKPTQMPIYKKATGLDVSQQGIAFLTVKIAETEFSGLPKLMYVYVFPIGGDGKIVEERGYRFAAVTSYREENKPGNKYRDYVVSMQLESGRYRIGTFHIGTSKGILAGAFGLAPILVDFEVNAGKVEYLGFMTAVHRKRKCGEWLMAGSGGSVVGSLVPFGDMVVGDVASDVFGYRSGTFEIDVVNNIDRDISVLRIEYPVLSNVQIEPALVPSPKRLSAEIIAARCEKEKQLQRDLASSTN